MDSDSSKEVEEASSICMVVEEVTSTCKVVEGNLEVLIVGRWRR